MKRSAMGLLTLSTVMLLGVGLITSWVMSPSEVTGGGVVAVGTTMVTSTAAPPLSGTDPTSPIGTVTALSTTLPATTPPITVEPATTVTDPTTTFTAPVTLTVAEQFLTAATNDLRGDLALPSLSVDVTLRAYASQWAMHMAVAGAVSHSDIDSLLGEWTIVGENVVSTTSIDAAVASLIASPPHYSVIVNPAFTEIGVGVVLDGEGAMWISQVFGGDLVPTTTLPAVTVPTISEVTLPTLP